jgi:uncharacterized membrane protein YqaE (UPF0057 family)
MAKGRAAIAKSETSLLLIIIAFIFPPLAVYLIDGIQM